MKNCDQTNDYKEEISNSSGKVKICFEEIEPITSNSLHFFLRHIVVNYTYAVSYFYFVMVWIMEDKNMLADYN